MMIDTVVGEAGRLSRWPLLIVVLETLLNREFFKSEERNCNSEFKIKCEKL